MTGRTETELKFRVADHQPVRARLSELAAQSLGSVLETNDIYDDRQRSLLQSGRGLRLRVCRDDAGKFVSATLTYKGPVQPAPAKHREEIETDVNDPDALGGILAALGFVRVLSFEKRRETWRLGDASVELDELPRLGTFVEIEAPILATIQSIREALAGLDMQVITETYVALVARLISTDRLPDSVLRF